MGSLQQIFLGAICVGGAFLMGHYLNHQTPLNSPFEKKSATAESTLSSAAPEALFQQRQKTAMLPNFRTQSKLAPAFDKVIDLPPPSQLDAAPPNPSTAMETSGRSGSSDQELDIEVPDFSTLAAQFKGTALELPALSSAPSLNAPVNPSQDSDPIPNFDHGPGSNPHVPANPEVKVPNFRTTINPVEDLARSERESAPRIEPVTESTETSFRAEDFAPRLRVDSLGSGASSMNSNPETDAAFATTDLSEVSPFPHSNSVLENNSALQPPHPNAVISYNDPFPTNTDNRTAAMRHDPAINSTTEFGSGLGDGTTLNPSGASPGWDKPNRGVPDRAPAEVADGSSDQWSIRDRSRAASEATNSADATQPRVPFGLNDAEKNRLSRLNHASTQVNNSTRFEEYRTVMGDTLHSISKRFYGKPDYFLDIYLANRHQLRTPAQVPAGIVLRLPIYE